MNTKPLVLTLLLTGTLWCGPVVSADSLPERHDDILVQIDESPLAEPIHLDYQDENGRLQGEIHALVEHSFDRVSGALGSAANWCEIIFLHQNTKACVHKDDGQTPKLDVYIGRKEFEEPQEAL